MKTKRKGKTIEKHEEEYIHVKKSVIKAIAKAITAPIWIPALETSVIILPIAEAMGKIIIGTLLIAFGWLTLDGEIMKETYSLKIHENVLSDIVFFEKRKKRKARKCKKH